MPCIIILIYVITYSLNDKYSHIVIITKSTYSIWFLSLLISSLLHWLSIFAYWNILNSNDICNYISVWSITWQSWLVMNLLNFGILMNDILLMYLVYTLVLLSPVNMEHLHLIKLCLGVILPISSTTKAWNYLV